MNNFDEDLISKYVRVDKQKEAFEKLNTGYPVQYIIGNVDFCGFIIDVNEDVLIPRFETEYLVDHVIRLCDKYEFQKPKILDIGTGSGCIAISLNKMRGFNLTALDISKDAISLAKKNAKKNNAEINFICKDIKDYKSKTKYNIIVSNPPYVSKKKEVDPKTKYEPQKAIFAPKEGLYFYEVILKKSLELLTKKSIIAFEIGESQKDAIFKIAKKYYPKATLSCLKDLNEKDRYFFIINE